MKLALKNNKPIGNHLVFSLTFTNKDYSATQSIIAVY